MQLTFTDPDYWRDWKPDPAHINALPGPVRRFIRDLETIADGSVREVTALRVQNAELIKKIEDLRAGQQST